MEWLSAIDFAAEHMDFSRRRQEGTGTWFMESPKFVNWLNGSNSILFCPGIPGAGKTILSSLVINYLWRIRQRSGTGIAYLYCKYRKYEQQKAVDLLSVLLKQLVQNLSSVPDTVSDLYEQHQRRRTRPSLDEISRTLHSVVESYHEVFVIIDALDECLDEHRNALLSELKSLKNLKLMITSRPIFNITQEFIDHPKLTIIAHKEDIECFVEHQISRLSGCVSRNHTLKRLVISEITNAADGMYVFSFFAALRQHLLKRCSHSS